LHSPTLRRRRAEEGSLHSCPFVLGINEGWSTLLPAKPGIRRVSVKIMFGFKIGLSDPQGSGLRFSLQPKVAGRVGFGCQPALDPTHPTAAQPAFPPLLQGIFPLELNSKKNFFFFFFNLGV